MPTVVMGLFPFVESGSTLLASPAAACGAGLSRVPGIEGISGEHGDIITTLVVDTVFEVVHLG